ncbi:MAG: hypothetical protein QOI10_1858 [Solirubrobacterales bacterium]|jgi:hypothetical protein|nr:hypothetical protein [Solirubrobacterales bacterium]
MAEELTRAEIGFGIGQVVAVRLAEGQLAELRKAVETGKGWYDLRTHDGTVALNLATVVFIRVNDSDHAIGFGG